MLQFKHGNWNMLSLVYASSNVPRGERWHFFERRSPVMANVNPSPCLQTFYNLGIKFIDACS